MAISLVQSAVGNGSAADNTTLSFTNTPTAGNKMIARCRGQDCTTTISIPGWNLDNYARVGSSATYVAILSKTAGAGESKDVTVTMASSSYTILEIEEWQEVNTLDKVAKTDNPGGTVTTRSTGTTATTTADAELCMAICGVGSGVTSPSWSNSFNTDFARGIGNITVIGGSKVISAAAAIESGCSWTTARLAGGCIATFKAGAAGPPKIKSINGVLIASVKTVNGIAIASVKSVQGIT